MLMASVLVACSSNAPATVDQASGNSLSDSADGSAPSRSSPERPQGHTLLDTTSDIPGVLAPEDKSHFIDQPGVTEHTPPADTSVAAHNETLQDGNRPLDVIPDDPPIDGCVNCWWWDVLLSLLSTAIGAFAAIWYEGLGHPRLFFSIAEVSDAPRPGRGRARFLYVAVQNIPRTLWFISRRTAYACEGTIHFVDQAGNTYKPMPIRWSGNPEPLKSEISDGRVVTLLDRGLMALSRTADIPPDKSKTIDVAMRLASSSSAYGWTDESYAHNWSHPEFALPQGTYTVHIEIATGDRVFQHTLVLENPDSLDGFALHESKSHN